MSAIVPTRRTKLPPRDRPVRLPDDAADRVREAVDLHLLVSREVKLVRRTHEWVGLCPFHAESTGSFTVVPAKRMWHCFGCGKNGDAFAWVMERRGLDFPSAVRALAQEFGVALDGPATHWSPPAAGTRRSAPGRLARPSGASAGTVPPARAESARGPSPFDWRSDLDVACRTELFSADGPPVLEYLLTGRKLSREAIDRFRLGALVTRAPDGTVTGRYVAIPCYDAAGACVTVRFRSVPGPCLRCGGVGVDCRRCRGTGQTPKAYVNCPGRELPLYNVGSLGHDRAQTVLITEGELDVVALWSYGLRGPTVSGTGGAKTWQDAWLDALEPFRQFVVCYDDDGPGEEGAKSLADRLGRYRCLRATLPRKDAGDCLISGVQEADVRAALANARAMYQPAVRRAGAYAAAVEALIQKPDTLVGLPTGSAKIDSCVGGWRPGLVVVTGETSGGKTSITTWLAAEQARRGVPVLLTSFEQQPIGTIQKLLRQEMGGDFTRHTSEERAAAMARLDAVPIHVYDHYGRVAKAEMIDVLRYAVRRLDVRLAVIDHAGYLADPEAQDERRDVDQLVRDLAELGINEELCVVVIFHPNRMAVGQQRRVTMKDLKGSSAIEQDAHLVLVVEANAQTKERPYPSTTIHADKVRSEFGYSQSSCVIAYDPIACAYADAWVQTPMGRSGRSGASLVVPGASEARATARGTQRTRRAVKVVDEPARPTVDAARRAAGEREDDDERVPVSANGVPA